MKYLPIITILFVLINIFSSRIFAGDFDGYSGVDADVKVSLCGDFIVEGDENCEPLVPIVQSCKDIGYDKGNLTCDNSCSYITTNCEYIPPKPILPPFPDIYNNEDDDNDGVITTYLPFFLEIYDLDNDGQLNTKEYCVGLEYWLKKWRIRLIDEQPEADINRIAGAIDTCDLNFDGNCDLVDFSIFLHNAE